MGGIYPENSSQLVQICSLDSRAKGLMGSHAAVSAMLQCTSNPKEMDTPFNLCWLILSDDLAAVAVAVVVFSDREQTVSSDPFEKDCLLYVPQDITHKFSYDWRNIHKERPAQTIGSSGFTWTWGKKTYNFTCFSGLSANHRCGLAFRSRFRARFFLTSTCSTCS